MSSYLAGRMLALAPVLLVVAVMVFLIARFTPGDPIRVLLGEDARPEQVQALRQLHGLDAPLPVQFGLWISRALRRRRSWTWAAAPAVWPAIWRRGAIR